MKPVTMPWVKGHAHLPVIASPPPDVHTGLYGKSFTLDDVRRLERDLVDTMKKSRPRKTIGCDSYGNT